MKRIVIGIFLICSLGSCHLYKRYERPDLKGIDSLYRSEEMSVSSGEDSTALATLSWKELFTDTLLQRLIEKGLQKNTDLNIARLKVKESELLLLSSKLSYLPSLELNPQGTISVLESENTQKTFSVTADASWEIDLFGKETNAKRGRHAELEGSEAYKQAVQTKLIATIAKNYYTLVMLDRQLEIGKETLNNWEQTIRTLELLKETGGTNDVAVLQAKANKMKLEGSLLAMEQDRTAFENALSTLLAEPPQGINRGTFDALILPHNISIGLPLALLANRPDVRQAEMQLAKSFYETNLARADFYPNLVLSGNGGWTNRSGTAVLNPARWIFNAVGSLIQPLFNRGKNVVNLKVSKLRQEEAALQFQQSLLEAGKQVNDALSAWQISEKKRQVDEQHLSYLEEAVRKTELLMDYSSVNYLEVLTAQQSLLSAEMTNLQHKFEQIQSLIDLYQALGGGVR